MFIRKFWRFGAAILALALSFSPAMAVDQVSFSGEVTYRERIALPPDASLRVTLVSLDKDRAPRTIGASAIIGSTGQVPLHFTFNVRADALSSALDYGLVAEIRAGNTVVFRNAVPVPVDPAGAEPVVIIVNSVPRTPAPPQPAPGDSDPDAGLFGAIWNVQSINGKPVLASTNVSLSIAPDWRAGGNGGCNSYFTQAMLEGPGLQFGPVAGTQMACDSAVMTQEMTYFTALTATADYALGDKTLDLLDAKGKPLVRLVRQ